MLLAPPRVVAADSGNAAAAGVWPGAEWERSTPAAEGMDELKLLQARDYALNGGGSGIIVRHGKVVMTWGDQHTQYDLKSSTKSYGSMLLGLALMDGKLRLDDRVVRYFPGFGVPPESNRATGWLDRITFRQLANQVAGFEKTGGYCRLVYEPGTHWLYSDGGPNWLADALTTIYGRDLRDLLFERILGPIGVTPDDLTWRKNGYRTPELNGVPRREFGSGIRADVPSMARVGYLYLREGRWQGRQLLPADYVRESGRTEPSIRDLPKFDPDAEGAQRQYSLLWYNNADGTLPNLPRDAYFSWGLYESHILVIPSLDIVFARAGRNLAPRNRPVRTPEEVYSAIKPLFEPIAESVTEFNRPPARKTAPPAEAKPQHDRVTGENPAEPPCPPSPVVKAVHWAPAGEIVRLARDSDTWPCTWGDDDRLYTAYGDGRGFAPFVERKLSMGLATVTGNPPAIHGENLRAPDAEFVGGGHTARKASGILMVDHVLYLLVRNAGNSQLAWSRDHGRTWTWAGWRFGTSFGCPTFLNFGPNYAGARDDYVYVYSQDSDSAYDAADRMVLARVPHDRIASEQAYEFFAGLDAAGRPQWTHDIAKRGAVFTNPGNCYRSSITYDAALHRYLWCQTLPHSTNPRGMRFQGGFGIYDAPEPWGPWTTVYYTPSWDVGPGETCSIPTKWMSPDGKSFHLLFSGEDSFSVRKAELELADGAKR